MMRAKHIRPQVLLLLVTNALLISLLGYEVVSLQQPRHTVMAEEAQAVEQSAVAKAPAAPARTIDDYAEVTNRPLFNSERRPLEKGEAEAIEEEALAFTLVGVVLTPEQQVAIIYSKNQKQPVKVALWDWIEGWRLVAVQANMVELRKGSRSVELVLQRASQSGTKR